MPPTTPWRKEDEKPLAELYEQGETFDNLVARFKCSRSFLAKKIRQLGLMRDNVMRRRAEMREGEDYIEGRFMDDDQIAALYRGRRYDLNGRKTK